MDDVDIFAFATLVLVVIAAWMFLGFLLWERAKSKKVRPSQVIGEITGVEEDENGLRITGKFNDQGAKLFKEEDLGFMSVGFHTKEGKTDVQGVRIIKDANLRSVSIDAKPGPYGGHVEKVDYIGTQPEGD